MKTTIAAVSIIATAFFVLACTAFHQGAPPTAFEQKLYDVQTNYVPKLVVVTNQQVVTEFKTNTVPVTNTVGVVEYRTNVVTTTVTNEVPGQQIVQQPQYIYTPGQGVQSAKEIGTAVGTPFGVGGLVGTAVAGLAALWGWFRSAKNYNTAANTTQVVETLRAFIQQLPNGSAYDTALTDWMQKHQADAGVLNNVLTILEKEVNTPEATDAAAQVRATLAGLGIVVPPPTPAPGPTTIVKTG